MRNRKAGGLENYLKIAERRLAAQESAQKHQDTPGFIQITSS